MRVSSKSGGPQPVGKKRGRRDRLWLALGALAAAAAILVAVVTAAGGGSPSPAVLPPAHLTGQLEGSAPWPRNVPGLGARLRELELPALAQEGTALHIHQHLDLYVDGRRVTVPANIGIEESQGFISPLHTHDESGVIHVESPDVQTFTLGQFFAVWGVRLTPRCLGGYCATGAKQLWVFVDGQRLSGDPRLLPLAEHQEILVAYGTQAQLPRPIPARYAFAATRRVTISAT
jgi:hypothetical protein